MKEESCASVLLTALDDVAWTYNMRGSDIMYNPVNYAFSYISDDEAVIYMNRSKLDLNGEMVLKNNGIIVKPYDAFYEDVATIKGSVLIDEGKTNYATLHLLGDKARHTEIFPVCRFKSLKNATEIKNMKKAHLDDAVAMIKFMRYLKKEAVAQGATEISVADQLEQYRRESKDFLDLSFDTICGTGPHGAIVHYSATPETDERIRTGTFCLVDSGAQYLTGTTDITRTYAVGKVSKEMKKDYTIVLKSHIALARAVFPKGTSGYDLDMLAREPLYEKCLNFRHGTGHGVGYILNVHEGPQRISNKFRSVESLKAMEPGMVTSDEPGLYIEGRYGIRHENLILCVEYKESEYGTFYRFEPLTWVPFDLDAVDGSLLTFEEKAWLNDYHKTVRKKIMPRLSDPSLVRYLEKVTRSI